MFVVVQYAHCPLIRSVVSQFLIHDISSSARHIIEEKCLYVVYVSHIYVRPNPTFARGDKEISVNLTCGEPGTAIVCMRESMRERA